jgi:hypothetical protein
MDQTQFAQATLLYFVLPLWLAAGLADYLCHRASHIEKTSGYKESLLHLLMFAEIAVPLLAALFFEINADRLFRSSFFSAPLSLRHTAPA